MSRSPYPEIPEHLAGAVLSIDLDAVAENYKTLCRQLNGVECGAVVKANAYGLGAERVAPVLASAGCREFFVAHIDEGIWLRRVLPDTPIHILNGLYEGAEEAFAEHDLIPALGSLHEVTLWKRFCGDTPLPCDLHIDTGMLRLGFPPNELAKIADDPNLIAGLDTQLVLSHLASADDVTSQQNAEQLAAFNRVRQIIPQGRASFCNSSGIFLGSDYHFNLGRPGVALYGANPTPARSNPMRATISLKARISQVRNAKVPEHVGYNATYAITRPTRVATAPVGYADGVLRSLSNRSCGYIGEHRVPLIGRVSMDLITFDVSDVPEVQAQPGQWIEMIGPHHTVDDMAKDADTIGYEILTSLGRRYHRVYKGGDDV